MKMTLLFATVLCVALSGCAIVGGKGGVELAPTTKPQYTTVFEAAVKACRELDLPLNVANKEVGQIQCGLKSIEARFVGVGYALDALIERDADQAVKNVSVKVLSRSGALWGVGTDSDANTLAERFIAILQRAGVK